MNASESLSFCGLCINILLNKHTCRQQLALKISRIESDWICLLMINCRFALHYSYAIFFFVVYFFFSLLSSKWLTCVQKWTRNKRVAHTTHEMISSPSRLVSKLSSSSNGTKKGANDEKCTPIQTAKKKSMQFTWRWWIFIIDAMSHAAYDLHTRTTSCFFFFSLTSICQLNYYGREIKRCKIATLMITFSINLLIDSLVSLYISLEEYIVIPLLNKICWNDWTPISYTWYESVRFDVRNDVLAKSQPLCD